MPKYGDARPAGLKSKRDEVTAAIAEKGREIQRLLRASRPRRASKKMVQNAVRLSQSMSGDEQAARLWLKKQGIVDATILDEAMEQVRKAMAGYTPGAVTGSAEGSAAVLPAGLLPTRLQKFKNEYRLHGWIQAQNLQKGLLPCSCDVLEKRATICDEGISLSSSRRARKQWLRRFRKRWDISLGRLQFREKLSDSEMQTKALRDGETSTPLQGLGPGT